LEYLTPPQGPDDTSSGFIWISWEIPKDTNFTTKCYCTSLDVTKFNQTNNYEFTYQSDRLEVSWSGTFVIAQDILLSVLPETIVMEVGSYLF
jgi:hypothetical protein